MLLNTPWYRFRLVKQLVTEIRDLTSAINQRLETLIDSDNNIKMEYQRAMRTLKNNETH